MTINVGQHTFLVVGNSDGNIRFYDDAFKAEAWFEDQLLSKIKSISFSNRSIQMSSHEKESSFRCPDFIVADDSAMVVQLQSSIFEAIEKKDKKG